MANNSAKLRLRTTNKCFHRSPSAPLYQQGDERRPLLHKSAYGRGERTRWRFLHGPVNTRPHGSRAAIFLRVKSPLDPTSEGRHAYNKAPPRPPAHLPHGVRVLAGLDAGGVDGAVGLVSDVKHHDRAVVAAHRQKGVVQGVEV